MALSAANVVQAKTGTVTADPAPVTLDAGTTVGNTVTVEISLGGLPIMDGGMSGKIPAGFEYDACSIAGGGRYQHVFRKRDVADGEGVAGSTSWDFSIGVSTPWLWRVTEWDTGLEPMSPMDAPPVYNSATGTSPTTLSTGTIAQGSRNNIVALCWHLASVPSATSHDWTGHTGGFTERDDIFFSSGASRLGSCWSWAFSDTPTTFECTATINADARSASDIFAGLLVVYAATIYA